MGTRSLIYTYETYKGDNGSVVNEPIMCLYGQYDGYLQGVGQGLAQFLNSGKLVNGLGSTKERVFNGMSCLSAQLVAEFKDAPGGFYLYPPKLGADHWQEYEYHVFADKVIVYGGVYPTDKLFEGTWDEFATLTGYMVDQKATLNVDNTDEVKEALHNGEVVITFIKKDGSERVMRATLNEGKIPTEGVELTSEVKTTKTRAANDEVLAVWDLDSLGWRSFRWDSLVSAKVA